jgi:hypothetical protein
LTSANDAVTYVTYDLAPLVAAVRAFQSPRGEVAGQEAAVRALLERVRAATHTALALVGADDAQVTAFDADLDRWCMDLSRPPVFDDTLHAYKPPDPGAMTLLVAPLRAINGPPPVGRFLECLLARRYEPSDLAALAGCLPGCQPRSQSVRVLAGSRGVMLGSCLACFPEFIAATRTPEVQAWGLFFASKFHGVFTQHTLPAASAVLGSQPWRSAALTPSEAYRVRALWAAVHDHFHEAGPRPLSVSLGVKSHWAVAVCDEVKVDCFTAAAMRRAEVPFAREIAETVLLDRFFRLPAELGAARGVDAAAGVLMFEWLLRHGAGIAEGLHGELTIDLDACLEALAELGSAIVHIEQLADDLSYIDAAEGFVRAWLPVPLAGRARYGDPAGFARLVRPRLPHLGLIDFARVA